jgi:hypothetical protein
MRPPCAGSPPLALPRARLSRRSASAASSAAQVRPPSPSPRRRTDSHAHHLAAAPHTSEAHDGASSGSAGNPSQRRSRLALSASSPAFYLPPRRRGALRARPPQLTLQPLTVSPALAEPGPQLAFQLPAIDLRLRLHPPPLFQHSRHWAELREGAAECPNPGRDGVAIALKGRIQPQRRRGCREGASLADSEHSQSCRIRIAYFQPIAALRVDHRS